MVKLETVNLEGKTYCLGYKVVTKDLKSLGLRKNPNILTYEINKWYALSENKIKEGCEDWGGIWVARTLSSAKGLRNYMKKEYSKQTRIFKTALDKILYFNSYRVKTNAVLMFEEIF